MSADRWLVESFVRGARVYIDKRDRATVRDIFPSGSTSLAAPYYLVDFADGDRGVKVPWARVGSVGPEHCGSRVAFGPCLLLKGHAGGCSPYAPSGDAGKDGCTHE